MKIVISGGSGLIGRSLVPTLKADNHDTIILTRNSQLHIQDSNSIIWDGKTAGTWADSLEKSDAIINLSGKSIDCILTKKNLKEILASRVNSIHALEKAIKNLKHPPKVIIQASAVGYYGNSDESCVESSPAGHDNLADICRQWENAFDASNFRGMRKVKFRIGVVLSRNSSIYKKLSLLTKLFLGGRAGSGKQWISWIHTADLCKMILYALKHEEINGVFNAVAPHPVTNSDLMRTFRLLFKRPWSPPVPAFLLHIGAFVLGSNASLVLTGQRCKPDKIIKTGFTFEFPQLDTALANVKQLSINEV